MSKKGREKKRRAAHKARTRAKARAAKAKNACERCGESDRHLRRFKVAIDGKTLVDWKTCRMCCAALDVLVSDRRNLSR